MFNCELFNGIIYEERTDLNSTQIPKSVCPKTPATSTPLPTK
jgi:hypothetical protein